MVVRMLALGSDQRTSLVRNGAERWALFARNVGGRVGGRAAAAGGRACCAIRRGAVAVAEPSSWPPHLVFHTPRSQVHRSPAHVERPAHVHHEPGSHQTCTARIRGFATASWRACSLRGDARSIHEQKWPTSDSGLPHRVNREGRGCGHEISVRANVALYAP